MRLAGLTALPAVIALSVSEENVITNPADSPDNRGDDGIVCVGVAAWSKAGGKENDRCDDEASREETNILRIQFFLRSQ